jgi:hypothetical protein
VDTTAAAQNIVFRIGEKSYQVNGQEFQMDVSPVINNNRTMLPIRYVALALGVKPENIIWDDKSKMATMIKDQLVVQIKVGEMAVYRSGISLSTDVAAYILDGRLMVPVRAISQSFGAEVAWENETRTVTITY